MGERDHRFMHNMAKDLEKLDVKFEKLTDAIMELVGITHEDVGQDNPLNNDIEFLQPPTNESTQEEKWYFEEYGYDLEGPRREMNVAHQGIETRYYDLEYLVFALKRAKEAGELNKLLEQ